jgi:glycosyltransferase involved in cell wall biosynthesis
VADETRVLQVLPRSAGGIGRHVAEIVRGLDGSDGLVIDVAAPHDLVVDLPKTPIRLDIPDAPTGSHLAVVGRLRRLISANGYDVVHGHGLRASIDAGLAARSSRVPMLATVHNLVQPEIAGRLRAPFYRWAEPFVVRLATRTFAPSEEIAEALRSAVPNLAERVEVLLLSPGAPPRPQRSGDEVREELELGSRPIVITVSRLAPQKDIPTLLRAVVQIPELVLVVVGEGPDREAVTDLTQQLGIAERTRFVGYRNDVVDLVSAADVFCLSSVWEARALAAQEAILLGVPVVSTDVGGMAELIEDGVSGRLVPKGDSAALGDALADLLASAELRTRFATEARRRLEAAASPGAMLDRLRDAYTKLR